MIKKSLFIILPLSLLFAGNVLSQEIIAVMDADRPHYQQALQGFRSACTSCSLPVGGIKSIQSLTISRIIIGDKNKSEITSTIRASRPNLILAIGNNGLRAAMAVHDVPIVYMLVANPNHIINKRKNITGVELLLSADLQLENMHKHLPDLKRLGVIYNPDLTGNLITEATTAAPNHNISIIAQPINYNSKIPALLNDMQTAKIDAFWMIPDLTVLNSATMQEILLFSFKNKIPLITFADKYLQQGAAVSISFDMPTVGVQAGEIAMSILNGTSVSSIPPQTVKQATVKRNARIIDKMGVTFNKTAAMEDMP